MASQFNSKNVERFNTQRGYGINAGTDRSGTRANEQNVLGDSAYTNKENHNGLVQTSTNIFVKSNGSIIGLIQSMQISENRNINKLQSVGFEGVAQAVPSNTNGGQIQISRIALYSTKLADIFGINELGKDGNNNAEYFVTLRNQRVPFEIETNMPNHSDPGTWYTDIYVDCWVSSWSRSYSVQQIYVVENMSVEYADVN